MKLSVSTLLILGCLLTPCTMGQGKPPDSGLLITRINSEQWQVSLIAGAAGQQFSGVIESDRPIAAVHGAGAASTANAKLLTSTSLGATLAAAPAGVDSVTFSASPGASLCLRDAGSSVRSNEPSR